MGQQGYRSAWLTGDVADAARSARRFFEQEVAPHRQRWAAQHAVDRSLWQAAGELGLLCASVPAELGGGGGDPRHDFAIISEQARIGEFGFGNAVHSGVVAGYLATYGSAEQQARWLPAMASGQAIAAIALTEPDAGSDLKAMRTKAVRTADGYRINGTKTFVTNGASADLIIVAAMTSPAAGPRGMSLFVVEALTSPGFRRGRQLEKIGQESADTTELFFDDCLVPAANVLGRENAGFAMLLDQLPRERLIVGIMAAATMERAVELTVRYVKERRAYQGTLFDLQHVRLELAECATLAHVGRVFLDDCIARFLRGELDTASASMAKYWLSDIQCQVIDRCMQLHGAYGYTREYPIGQLYADARAQRIYGGANEVMKELIAGSL